MLFFVKRKCNYINLLSSETKLTFITTVELPKLKQEISEMLCFSSENHKIYKELRIAIFKKNNHENWKKHLCPLIDVHRTH